MPRMPPPGGSARDEEAKMVFDDMVTFVQRLSQARAFIPDPVIQNIVAQAGMFTSDPSVSKILNIECHKFIWDMMNKLKETVPRAEENGERMVRLENVKQVLAQKRMRVDRPDFIVGPIARVETQEPLDFEFFDFPGGGEAF